MYVECHIEFLSVLANSVCVGNDDLKEENERGERNGCWSVFVTSPTVFDKAHSQILYCKRR